MSDKTHEANERKLKQAHDKFYAKAYERAPKDRDATYAALYNEAVIRSALGYIRCCLFGGGTVEEFLSEELWEATK